MNAQYWQALGAIVVACGALYGVVTAPLLRLIKAESGLIKAEMAALEARLNAKIDAVEARLNERLADKLQDHGERITRLEERRFR